MKTLLKFTAAALVIFLAPLFPACQTFGAVIAKPTNSIVVVDGKSIAFEAYNINDYNYFKLRDLAFVLNGSERQFSVGWDSGKKAITLTLGSPYKPTGEEMSSKGSGNKPASVSDAAVYLSDGSRLNLDSYNIDGYNYYKLRDVGASVNFNVGWDANSNTITIVTTDVLNNDLAASEYHPFVVGGFLLGGTYKGKWMPQEDVTPHLNGKERYMLYSFTDYLCGGAGSITPYDGSGPNSSTMVDINPDKPDLLKKLGIRVYLSLSASWNPYPRKAERLSSDNKTYKQLVSDVLKQKGLPVADPAVMQIYRVDLEGDGTDEVIINAQNIVKPSALGWNENIPLSDSIDGVLSPVFEKGQYSLVYIRKIINGQTRDIFIYEGINTKNESSDFADGPPMLWKIQQFADLNGDGKLEIVFGNYYYEGEGYDVFEVNGSKADWVCGGGWGA